MVQLSRDAVLVLRKLAGRPDASAFVPAPDLANETGAAASILNVAVFQLARHGYVQMLPGRAPGGFEFSDAIATPEGRVHLQELNAQRQPPEEPAGRAGLTPIRLFISHSSADQFVAGKLAKAFELALSLPNGQVRCSTVPGYKLAGGVDVDAALLDEIIGAETFVAIVSPASLKSFYVTCEIGARLGADQHLLPLRVAGVEPASLPEPLKGLNTLSMADHADLVQCLSEIAERLGIASPALAKCHDELGEIARMPASLAAAETQHVQVFFHQKIGEYHSVALEICQLFQRANLDGRNCADGPPSARYRHISAGAIGSTGGCPLGAADTEVGQQGRRRRGSTQCAPNHRWRGSTALGCRDTHTALSEEELSLAPACGTAVEYRRPANAGRTAGAR